MRNKAVIYMLIALLSLLLACISKDYDYDLYARLIVGERFLSGLGIAYNDFLSYTPTHIWYDHEWGSGVVFYAFLKYLGPFGLVLLHALLMFFTAFFVIKTQEIQKHAYPTSLCFITIFLLFFSHQNPSIVRCHMFSFMFFSMFLYLLEKTRLQGSNILWFVPLITVIWNNLHGGIVSGLGIIFIYGLCAFITKKPWRKYLYVLVVSSLLLAVNPYGIAYLDFLVSANTKTRTFITEWWNVFVVRHARYYFPIFMVSLFTAFITLINYIQRRKFNITKLSLLAMTLYLGFVHVKLLSLTIIVVASLFYNDIATLFRKKAFRFFEFITFIGLICAVCYIPFSKPAEVKADSNKFPLIETEFLQINNLDGNLLTTFGYGSYVAYKRYPQNLIYMDGRYEEVYNDEELNNLMYYELAEPKMDNVVNLYPTDILMSEKIIPVYEKLEQSPNWVKIFEGPVCGIFVKKENAKTNYLIPSNDLRYYQDNHFNTNKNFGRKNEKP